MKDWPVRTIVQIIFILTFITLKRDSKLFKKFTITLQLYLYYVYKKKLKKERG